MHKTINLYQYFHNSNQLPTFLLSKKYYITYNYEYVLPLLSSYNNMKSIIKVDKWNVFVTHLKKIRLVINTPILLCSKSLL